jgi:hypothetical protein
MVKSYILSFLIFICCSFSQQFLFSQVYYSNDLAKDKHFIYEVKEIDEFIERFNDDPGSFLRGVYKSYHMKFNLDRQRLIKSLFNYEHKTWDSDVMSKFISEVTNKQKPVYLDFNGGNWYAELTCMFHYKSSSIVIPLILEIETTKNKGSKWMIVAVGSSLLKSNTLLSEMIPSKVKSNCISPTSHATNFVSLKRAFADKVNLSNYFEIAYFKGSNMQEFYNAVLNNQIEFQYTIKIRYHFLLANKWVFTVEDFPREALNSGWLINNMREVSSSEMESYRNKLLSGN